MLGKSQKCIFCYPRLEQGKVNACAAQCPGRLRFVGLLDDPESPVHKLVLKYHVALGLLPERRHLEEIRAFLQQHAVEAAKQATAQTLERLEQDVSLRERAAPGVGVWLKTRG